MSKPKTPKQGRVTRKPREWMPIPGHPRYEASNLGDIRHIVRKEIRKQTKNWVGYMRVCLFSERAGGGRMFTVHRLVLAAFVGWPTDDRVECDHIDKDRSNNRIENLRWVSPADNKINRTVMVGEANNKTTIPAEVVSLIRQNVPETGKTHRAKELADRYGIHFETVLRIWRMETRRYG